MSQQCFSFQFDFGTCGLTFTQFVVYGQPASTSDLTLNVIDRNENLEVVYIFLLFIRIEIFVISLM